MKRRKFIITTAMSFPALSFAQGLTQKPGRSTEKGFVIKAGKNRFKEDTKLGGINPVDIKVSTSDTNGVLSISEYTGYTKGGPPLHIHPYQDEVFYILEGEHLFQLGDEQYHLTAGDTIFIPRNVPHAPCQLSEKGKYLYFFTPSGKMEDFFRAIDKLEVKGQPPAELMAPVFVAHDIKIVGPPVQF